MRFPFLLLTAFAATVSMAQGPCDSLAAASARQQEELIRQRLQLDRMLMDMEEVRFQVAKARKEAEVLRQVMKGYIVTIDSLQRENRRLQEAVKR
jgi:hypothetical protein